MDTIPILTDKKINLEFDMKRHLVNAVAINIVKDGIQGEGVFMHSIPWHNQEQFYNARAYFTDWTQTRLLKTEKDFADWNEFYLAKSSAKGKGVNVRRTCTEGVLLRQFIRCYVRQIYGTDSMKETYRELAEKLTKIGYPTTESAIKNAKRKKFKIIEHCVADTPKTRELLTHILALSPQFQYQAFFKEGIKLPH